LRKRKKKAKKTRRDRITAKLLQARLVELRISFDDEFETKQSI